ncbi:MAG: hypothetical protein ACFBSC_10415 [Microcoleaceae cyanobacterium]
MSLELTASIADGVEVLLESAGHVVSFVLSLREPAPMGGLTINLDLFDEDGEGERIYLIETENIESIRSNSVGLPDKVTLPAGVVKARLTFTACKIQAKAGNKIAQTSRQVMGFFQILTGQTHK